MSTDSQQIVSSKKPISGNAKTTLSLSDQLKENIKTGFKIVSFREIFKVHTPTQNLLRRESSVSAQQFSADQTLSTHCIEDASKLKLENIFKLSEEEIMSLCTEFNKISALDDEPIDVRLVLEREDKMTISFVAKGRNDLDSTIGNEKEMSDAVPLVNIAKSFFEQVVRHVGQNNCKKENGAGFKFCLTSKTAIEKFCELFCVDSDAFSKEQGFKKNAVSNVEIENVKIEEIKDDKHEPNATEKIMSPEKSERNAYQAYRLLPYFSVLPVLSRIVAFAINFIIGKITTQSNENTAPVPAGNSDKPQMRTNTSSQIVTQRLAGSSSPIESDQVKENAQAFNKIALQAPSVQTRTLEDTHPHLSALVNRR
jgi:hypothetical protein